MSTKEIIDKEMKAMDRQYKLDMAELVLDTFVAGNCSLTLSFATYFIATGAFPDETTPELIGLFSLYIATGMAFVISKAVRKDINENKKGEKL
ncbi:hypothetical protein [Salinicola rhizosphaerae]|uniref:YrhC-like protein n=1 Tax=Salinicola rhizosphaerae TaxID=1443141 RepID=A0ABQ3DR81_9GAMM|nr:hypothetical protein [Salinicola rhizosphaerae]GHB12915.1 hypothetical protein GCM10009038_08690 [Salinicola rhizosphaerae]